MNGSWSWIADAGSRVLNYLVRKRSVGVSIMKLGGGMMMTASLGLIIQVSIGDLPLDGEFSLSLNDESFATKYLFLAGLFTLLFGAFVVFLERINPNKKNTIAVELRGLRRLTGNPVSEVVEGISGHNVRPVLVDLTSPYADGRIDDPVDALGILLSALPRQVQAEANDRPRSDNNVLFGGLAPVPFTMLAGQLLDDERDILVVDWDRNQKSWRRLDGFDDGKRLELVRADAIDDHDEVCLVVSFSYGADIAGCERSFPGIPIRHLSLETPGTDVHWSEHKQRAIASQFLKELNALSGMPIKQIHLVLAGPSSLVFRLGTHIDNRNLPDVIVYQYERDQEPCYPWGVKLPMRGAQALVVHRENQSMPEQQAMIA